MLRRARIDPSELQLGELLGSGSFGEVRRAVWHGTPVAVKRLHRSKINAKDLHRFRRECQLQLGLRHPNIVQLVGGAWTLDDARVMVVLELCERALADLLARKHVEKRALGGPAGLLLAPRAQ